MALSFKTINLSFNFFLLFLFLFSNLITYGEKYFANSWFRTAARTAAVLRAKFYGRRSSRCLELLAGESLRDFSTTRPPSASQTGKLSVYLFCAYNRYRETDFLIDVESPFLQNCVSFHPLYRTSSSYCRRNNPRIYSPSIQVRSALLIEWALNF